MNRLVAVHLTLVGILLLFLPACVGEGTPEAAPPEVRYVEDLEAAWTFVRDHYAYFEEKGTDWERVRTDFQPRAASVETDAEFIALMEKMLEELYDHHVHLGVNTASSPRLVPSGTDLWAEHRGGVPMITDVRAGSRAERAGLRPGLEVVAVDGRPVGEVVDELLPAALREADPAADDWALRVALAGRHDRDVEVEVRSGRRPGERFRFRPGLAEAPPGLLSAEVLDDGIGYVRLHDSLGEEALVAAWDSALSEVRDTRALILDLRDTPGGGNSTVARGLLGRLVSEARPYQRHELPSEERRFGVKRVWTEYVAPRGPFTYGKPMAVLVGRWTGSMGEGVAIGLDGMGRATPVGTPMAGLRGAIHAVTLPHSGIEVRVPAERLYHVDGTPREAFVPAVRVEDVTRPGEEPAEADAEDDPALLAALDLLRGP